MTPEQRKLMEALVFKKDSEGKRRLNTTELLFLHELAELDADASLTTAQDDNLEGLYFDVF